ncbi:hypothetical protein, partial [Rhodoplanes serenus]|uniref:hypothetical protein n=1 Tax=Rhodoplanes serenus TaxID=200615 RepID=UPI001A90D71B
AITSAILATLHGSGDDVIFRTAARINDNRRRRRPASNRSLHWEELRREKSPNVRIASQQLRRCIRPLGGAGAARRRSACHLTGSSR